MGKCHKESSCSGTWVITFYVVQIRIITDKKTSHNCSDCMWSVILCIFSATCSVVVLNKIFKNVCKKVVMFAESFFKTELCKLVYKCSRKVCSLAVICNILSESFKNRNLCICNRKCRKDFHILCSNIFHC